MTPRPVTTGAMVARSSLRRLLALPWRDAARLAEAGLMLAFAAAAIRLLPFARVARIAEGRRRARAAPDDATTDAVRRAVQAWARRVPFRAVCFQQGLAVHLMLRRRGIASVMHYGVAQLPAEGPDKRKLAAHVWVSAGGRDVIGGEEAQRFTCLASFPA